VYAVNDTPIPISVEVLLPLSLAGVVREIVALVSPKVDVIMLGLDWMSKHHVRWNIGAGYISIGDQIYLLNEKRAPWECRKVQPSIDMPVIQGVTESTDDYAMHCKAYWSNVYRHIERHLDVRSVAQANFVEKSFEKTLSKAISGLFKANEWVSYFSKRASSRQSPKKERKYSDPYLIVEVLDSNRVVIQRSVRSQPIITMVDRLKKCVAEHPRSWLSSVSAYTESSNGDVDECIYRDRTADRRSGLFKTNDWVSYYSKRAS